MTRMMARGGLLAVFVPVLVECWGAGLAPGTQDRKIVMVSASQPRGFRGDGSGRYPGARPPLEWGQNKNILWSTKIGPNKYSSPVVVDRRIYLVAEPDLMVCVDASSGAILWQKSTSAADLPEKVAVKPPRGDAGNTTPTPVSDGRSVYAVFGNGIVSSCDLGGERKWIRFCGEKPAPEYGRSASPALADGRLLVTLSCLIALDAATGKELWRNQEVTEQYGTPIVARIGGVEVAVMASGQVVRVSDGKLLASDLGGLRFASPILQDDTVFLIQAGASAQRLIPSAPDKWEVKQVWDQELEGTFYASAVCDQGLIYAVSNEGNFYILDSKDGKILASRELDLTAGSGRPAAAGANMYPSLVLAGNCLIVSNDQGDAVVLEPGRQVKEIRRNHLGAGHGSAPVLEEGRMYLRGDQNLYCVGEDASSEGKKR